jgi:hypothetical protein
MPDADKLTPADADLAKALAYALRFEGRNRVHNPDEIMSEIAACGAFGARRLRCHDTAGRCPSGGR